MHQLFQGKEIGKTGLGSTYGILQDAPNSFHVSVSRGNNTIYDHVSSVSSKDDIINVINLLEKELIEKFNLTPVE